MTVEEFRDLVALWHVGWRSSEDVVRAEHIPAGLGGELAGPDERGAAEEWVESAPGATLQAFKDATERAFLLRKLRENDWNVAATAKAIDTPRSNLYKKLEAYDIRREKDG